MPVAVANVEETQRFDLKSLPEAYVVLRRMTYGQQMERRTLTKLSLDMGGKKGDLKGELVMATREMNAYEFRHCIVEHNLCHSDGVTPLNFNNANDMAALDPKVGTEIEKLIADLNSFDEGE